MHKGQWLEGRKCTQSLLVTHCANRKRKLGTEVARSAARPNANAIANQNRHVTAKAYFYLPERKTRQQLTLCHGCTFKSRKSMNATQTNPWLVVCHLCPGGYRMHRKSAGTYVHMNMQASHLPMQASEHASFSPFHI